MKLICSRIPLNFTARNPKDVVVSFYYHTVGFPFYDFKEGKFDDYFELFINGKVDFGDYFKMVPEWWEQSKKKKNIHFVLYENLKTNFEEWVVKFWIMNTKNLVYY